MDRFWQKVQADRSDADGCWLWLAYRQPDGYGLFRLDGAMRLAHRVAYELEVGPIPDGLQLDHLCRNRACVNPAHLEPVTGQENISRAPRRAPTHCKRGHEFTAENTYLDKRGSRHCRACNNAASIEYRRRVGRATGVGRGFRSDPRPGYGTYKRRLRQEDRPRCKGTKRQPPNAGRQCLRPALHGSEFCQSHEPSRELARHEEELEALRKMKDVAGQIFEGIEPPAADTPAELPSPDEVENNEAGLEGEPADEPVEPEPRAEARRPWQQPYQGAIRPRVLDALERGPLSRDGIHEAIDQKTGVGAALGRMVTSGEITLADGEYALPIAAAPPALAPTLVQPPEKNGTEVQGADPPALAYLNEYLPNGQAAAIVPALPSNEVTLSLTREEAEAVLAASIVGSPVHKTWHIKPFLDAKAKLDAALSSTREPEG